MNELQITGEMAGEIAVATLRGDIDLVETDHASEELTKLAGSTGVALVLDLDRVHYVDSSGVRMLFSLARELEVRRRSLVFVLSEASPLCRLFKVTGLDELVPIAPTVPEALARLNTARGVADCPERATSE